MPLSLTSPAVPLRVRSAAPRDSDRAKVYSAEQLLRAQLDAARAGARTIEVAGSAVILPIELQLGTLAAAQTWVDRLQSLPSYVQGWGAGRPRLRLRIRAGQERAHWESPGTIAVPVPVHGRAWALRELVLLHEVAHHVTHPLRAGEVAHGPRFREAFVDLVRDVLGPEAAWVLSVHLESAGAGAAR